MECSILALHYNIQMFKHAHHDDVGGTAALRTAMKTGTRLEILHDAEIIERWRWVNTVYRDARSGSCDPAGVEGECGARVILSAARRVDEARSRGYVGGRGDKGRSVKTELVETAASEHQCCVRANEKKDRTGGDGQARGERNYREKGPKEDRRRGRRRSKNTEYWRTDYHRLSTQTRTFLFPTSDNADSSGYRSKALQMTRWSAVDVQSRHLEIATSDELFEELQPSTHHTPRQLLSPQCFAIYGKVPTARYEAKGIERIAHLASASKNT
ncbi:hypothetical protein R3P38DRAFT_3609637 [Favolaschia claudopus]|uniref:Uncharacterized protein n=1 Tax=Favolaschia claudopus TaxID=2862362 RepID=A0AAW0A6L1_9AGAR